MHPVTEDLKFFQCFQVFSFIQRPFFSQPGRCSSLFFMAPLRLCFTLTFYEPVLAFVCDNKFKYYLCS